MAVDEAAIISTWPSGVDFATKSVPMVVPAPGLLSIITGWPSALDRCGAMIRAVTSFTPPGGKFTTILTGRFG